MNKFLCSVAVVGSLACVSPAFAGGFNIADLQTTTVNDLTIALQDAQAHNDAPAVQCYTGALAYVEANPLAIPTVNVAGVVSGFQVARDGVKLAEAAQVNGIVPDQLNQACGWLAVDVQKDAAKIASGGFSLFGVKLF